MLYPTLCVCFGAGSHHGTFICTVAKGGASIAMQPSSIPFAGQSGARNFSLWDGCGGGAWIFKKLKPRSYQLIVNWSRKSCPPGRTLWTQRETYFLVCSKRFAPRKLKGNYRDEGINSMERWTGTEESAGQREGEIHHSVQSSQSSWSCLDSRRASGLSWCVQGSWNSGHCRWSLGRFVLEALHSISSRGDGDWLQMYQLGISNKDMESGWLSLFLCNFWRQRNAETLQGICRTPVSSSWKYLWHWSLADRIRK